MTLHAAIPQKNYQGSVTILWKIRCSLRRMPCYRSRMISPLSNIDATFALSSTVRSDFRTRASSLLIMNRRAVPGLLRETASCRRSGCPPGNNLPRALSNPRTPPRRKAARAGSFKRLARVHLRVLLWSSLWAAVHYSGDISALFQSPAIPLRKTTTNRSMARSCSFPLSGNTCRQSLPSTMQQGKFGTTDLWIAKSRRATMREWATLTATKRAIAIRGSFAKR